MDVAVANGNELAFRITQHSRDSYIDLGALRRARQFSRNNYEHLANQLTKRVTTNKSQQLAVARSAGFNTSGLIVGGQRDVKTRGLEGERLARSGWTSSKTPTTQTGTRTSSGEAQGRSSSAKTSGSGVTSNPNDGLTAAERRLLSRGGDL